MSSTRSLVASAVAVFSNRPRSRGSTICGAHAPPQPDEAFASGSRFANLSLDHVEDQVGPGCEIPGSFSQSWSSISSIFRADLELLLGTQHVPAPPCRGSTSPGKLAGSSSPRTFFLALTLTSGAASSSSSSSSSSSASSSAASARTSPATSSVSSVSISTPGVAPSAPSRPRSRPATGQPQANPIASADSGSVSLAGTGRAAETFALASNLTSRAAGRPPQCRRRFTAGLGRTTLAGPVSL